MFFRVQKCFIAFSVAILFVVNWPNHDPGVDVEQGASSARGSLTVAVDSTLPCCRAFAWEWCRHLLLELAAILSDTVKYEHILTSYYASHEI